MPAAACEPRWKTYYSPDLESVSPACSDGIGGGGAMGHFHPRAFNFQGEPLPPSGVVTGSNSLGPAEMVVSRAPSGLPVWGRSNLWVLKLGGPFPAARDRTGGGGGWAVREEL